MTADPSRFPRGAGRFTDDLAREDALHLAVVRSDLLHGVIEDIEVSEAENLPHVHHVLTAADLDHVPRIPVRVGPTPRLEARLQTVLAVDSVRYVGEPIAVVLAAAARDGAAIADAFGDAGSSISELPIRPETVCGAFSR